ncbi:YihY/virulence factor BrkB family protein [Novosphingobium sp. PhB55]|uniref:YihY/virulence factor BrkB family protein n=1 Tax=Novosphingobium sp. PhB55 TaxID=2485106 RepID=UPI001FBA018E|nr:YihY/virulence factor BrkB family protein [Novosphingobium sp. PhB55]
MNIDHSIDVQAPGTPASAAITPEARRRAAMRWQEMQDRIPRPDPSSRAYVVVKRVFTGTWEDGFIHAGNFAYMTIVALFPFFIALAAIYSALGEQGQLESAIDAVLNALPPRVDEALAPVARDAVAARHGWLLWIGGVLGLWTATSLIETIRDILHRAYGMNKGLKFWRNRLASSGLIFGSVLLLLLSLSSQVLISVIEEVLLTVFPGLKAFNYQIGISRGITAATLFASLYALFFLLTPSRYQSRRYRKWPGPLFVAAWWLGAAWLLPKVLRNFIAYDLTYGSLAGVMIALFFFWLVGLGMVAGAELNAALTVSPEEQEMLAGGPGGNSSAAAQNNEVQEEHE